MSEAIKQALEALEESQSLLVAMLHEQRSHDEITAQILENRGAINVLAALASAEQPQPVAVEFIDHIINGVFEGCDWDGGSIQDLAVKYGLLKPVEMQAQCAEEGCQCAQMDADFPAICFRKTYTAPQASQPTEEVHKELESMTRMFHAACADLGQINEALGLDPDDGGAEPILDAIEELKAQASQPVALTDEQIADIAASMEASDPTDRFWVEFVRKVEARIGSATSQPSAWNEAIEALSRLRGKHRSESGHFESDTGAWIADCDEADAYDAALLDALEAIRALRQQAPAVQEDLHAAIMNLPCHPCCNDPHNEQVAYRKGHRDARHAAAELAAAPASHPAPAQTAPVVSSGWKRTFTRVVDCLEILDKRPRPMCRDCADEDGTCPNSSLDCDMRKLISDARAMLSAAPSAPIAANSDDAGWLPIETAPEVKGDFFFCRLAWGPDEDKSTGQGFRWQSRWFAAAVFHAIGQERRLVIREVEVTPTHWMPLPSAPIAATAQQKEGE